MFLYIMKHVGFCLIVLGSVVLILLQLLHFTSINILLTAPLIFILMGIVLHVWGIKRESHY